MARKRRRFTYLLISCGDACLYVCAFKHAPAHRSDFTSSPSWLATSSMSTSNPFESASITIAIAIAYNELANRWMEALYESSSGSKLQHIDAGTSVHPSTRDRRWHAKREMKHIKTL